MAAEAEGRLADHAGWLEMLARAVTTSEKERPKRKQMAADLRAVLATLSSERTARIAAEGERDAAKRLLKLEPDWFDQIEDMLDDYSDAEIIDGTTHPNKAMRLLCELREAMGR
jgi:hypothetical protein